MIARFKRTCRYIYWSNYLMADAEWIIIFMQSIGYSIIDYWFLDWYHMASMSFMD